MEAHKTKPGLAIILIFMWVFLMSCAQTVVVPIQAMRYDPPQISRSQTGLVAGMAALSRQHITLIPNIYAPIPDLTHPALGEGTYLNPSIFLAVPLRKRFELSVDITPAATLRWQLLGQHPDTPLDLTLAVNLSRYRHAGNHREAYRSVDYHVQVLSQGVNLMAGYDLPWQMTVFGGPAFQTMAYAGQMVRDDDYLPAGPYSYRGGFHRYGQVLGWTFEQASDHMAQTIALSMEWAQLHIGDLPVSHDIHTQLTVRFQF